MDRALESITENILSYDHLFSPLFSVPGSLANHNTVKKILGRLGELSDFLAKQEQLSSFKGLPPIAASIKEGLLALRSTIVLESFQLPSLSLWLILLCL